MKKFVYLLIVFIGVACGGVRSTKYIAAPPSDPAPVPAPIENCKTGQAVSFAEDILPLVQKSCFRCHPGYETYATMVKNIDEAIKRINLPFNDQKRMPLSPSPLLDIKEIQLFENFKADGLQPSQACKDDLASAVEQVKSLNDIETEILRDLNLLNVFQANQARQLIVSHRFNAGASALSLLDHGAAINKALNSLSSSNRIIPPTTIDKDKTIYRFFLNDYGLNASDWNNILFVNKFDFVSNTQLGNQIKVITGVDQPWLHADNFINIALGKPEVYASLMRTPPTIDELNAFLEIDVYEEAENFNLRYIGFNGSVISLQKNRLLVRAQNKDGDKYLWTTYDTNLDFVFNKNLFAFPLLYDFKEAEKIFNFDASEVIYTLDNGLQGYALYGNDGNIAFEAPPDIVRNVESTFSPIIKVGMDCFLCHSKGLVPAVDMIRAHVEANGSEFSAGDKTIIDAVYKNDITNKALFQADIASYSIAAEKVGNGLEEDTINLFVDELRKDLNIVQVASFVFLSVDEFDAELKRSAVLKAQIGQLLTGGTITLVQFQESFPDIIIELRLGEDDVDK